MAHLRSIGSLLSSYASHRHNQNITQNEKKDVIKKGYLAKQKNMKNKYFVLRKETNKTLPARLECYDSEEKFMEGCQPKKKYFIEKCFNIIKCLDENVTGISFHYVNKNCITLIAQTETDLQSWISNLHQLKFPDPELIESQRTEYEYVWQVEVMKRNLGSDPSLNLCGQNWLCLNDQSLSLVRVDDQSIRKKFSLNTIKHCCKGHYFFYIQLGRCSSIGKGGITVETRDSRTAKDICASVSRAMNNFRLPPSRESKVRKRSTSDPQPETSSAPGRTRADSVPGNLWNRPHTLKLNSFLEQTLGFRNIRNGMSFSNNLRMKNLQLTPDKEFVNIEETPQDYLDMSLSRADRIIISRCYSDWLRDFKSSDEDTIYTPMDSGTGPPPCNGGLEVATSPMSITPPSRMLSPLTLSSLGSLTPVSSLSSSPGGLPFSGSGYSSSPRASIGSHSRSLSLEESEYVLMLSPEPQGFQLPQTPKGPYLDMGPVPDGGCQGTRAVPTPLPLSASDDS